MTGNEQLYVCTEALRQLEKKANDTLRDLYSAFLFLLSRLHIVLLLGGAPPEILFRSGIRTCKDGGVLGA